MASRRKQNRLDKIKIINVKNYSAFLMIWSCMLMTVSLFSQHTFSIVAFDASTGEVGSAGATCLDNNSFPGSGGAIIISDVIPGLGAVHTQSYWNKSNQDNAHLQLEGGKPAGEIVTWLVNNDAQNDPFIRQYGAVTVSPIAESAGYTGINCFDEKSHLLGPNYAIQGNILINKSVLDSMEANFKRTENLSLCERLMAALQGANIAGADSRCLAEGVSSRSAFIRVARAGDDPDDLWMDINVPSTGFGVEPIDSLQVLFDAFKATLSTKPGLDRGFIEIYPNPTSNIVRVVRKNAGLVNDLLVRLTDVEGREIMSREWPSSIEELEVNISAEPGTYIISVIDQLQRMIIAQKQLIVSTNNH
jgi:uncharacterized Ntn-hydrolase superfamily protein